MEPMRLDHCSLKYHTTLYISTTYLIASTLVMSKGVKSHVKFEKPGKMQSEVQGDTSRNQC